MKKKLLITATALSLIILNTTTFAENNELSDDSARTENKSITMENTIEGYINASSVNFRIEPNLESHINYTLEKFESLDIIQKEGDWTKVNHKDTVGYVYSKYVSEGKKEDAEKVSEENVKKLTVKATAYAGDTITSTGTVPKWGTIAVDPTVIPYGTKIYIPEFDKVFIAEDCGGAIKGNRIDIFMDTEEHCNEWGIRDIEIQILP